MLVARQQAAEHFADVVGKFHIQPGQRAVNPFQQTRHTAEHAAQGFARGFAFKQIGFHAACEFLVMLPLLFKAHRRPSVAVLHAEPVQGRLKVRHNLPLALCHFRSRYPAQIPLDTAHGFQFEMAELMDEGGSVGVFQQRNRVGHAVEHTACVLIQNTVIIRRERAAVIGGRFDLVRTEGCILNIDVILVRIINDSAVKPFPL